MDLLSVITILLIVSAVFSYLNERFVRLPGTIGVVTIAVVVSILILVAGKTNVGMANIFTDLAENINFSSVLMNVLLGFLLFAGALHFDYNALKKQRLPVLLLSTLGVLVSTGVFGLLLYGAVRLLPIDLPLIYCLVFGALISPTDPIAVSAILQNSRISPKLNTIISGESLFNDAVGLILFVVFLNIAAGSGHELPAMAILKLFVQEVAGGVITGLVLGYLGYRMIRSIKDFQSILLISIAVVLAISAVAHQFNASIPLAAVTAGLVMGTKTLDKRHITHQFLNKVWQLLDQVLNTVLFVMIGLQLVIMPFLNHYWLIGSLSVIIILLARLVSVSLPAIPVLRKINLSNFFILTWAGLRGGISIAMALTLPESPYRQIILSCCYIIVIFSIIVQGLTLNRVVEHAARRKA